MSDGGVEHVVLGATGHIGSAVASVLLQGGHRVRVVTRSREKADAWTARGASAAVLDLADRAALGRLLADDRPVRVFVLNPLGPIDGDPDAAEVASADAVVDALHAARPERVVAISTYGARAGTGIGDLGTLHHLERRLGDLSAPVAVVRAGYLLSNWDGALAGARTDGEVAVMLDPARPLPMVDPADVGAEAARLLTLPTPFRGVVHVEGPERPTPQDVADAFATGLDAPVRVRRIAPGDWRDTFVAAGFSAAAADTFTGLNRVVDGERWRLDAAPVRGATTLQVYVDRLIAMSAPI